MIKKIDSHCHFGGMITPEIVYEIAGKQLDLNLTQIRHLMTADKYRDFNHFLNCFNILDQVNWNISSVINTIRQICQNIHNNNITHISISLSLNKYLHMCDDISVLARLIQDAFQLHCKSQYNLLLALKYEGDKIEQLNIVQSIMCDDEVFDNFAGIDLVGDEYQIDENFYMPIFDEWRKRNKVLRAHVGEIKGTEKNVEIAIDKLQCTRIAHGIYTSDDCFKDAVARNTVFDIALHSNLMTGVVDNIDVHPIKHMLDLGCCITLNTDDPVQFNCNIDDEFILASKILNDNQLQIIHNNAIKYFKE